MSKQISKCKCMMVYQIISAYFEDDCADELTLDPVFNAMQDI